MSTVEEIVTAVKDLPPDQRLEVQRRVEALLNEPKQDATNSDETRKASDLNQRIHRALYEAGLVSEIDPPARPRRERPPPIKIKGKPLSETIIEDRR